MKSSLTALVCAVAVVVSLSSQQAQASVNGKTYNATVLTPPVGIGTDTFAFGENAVLTTSSASGEWNELDFGILSIWFSTVTDNENSELKTTYAGLQFQTFLIAQGLDTEGLTSFVIGAEATEGARRRAGRR